MICAIAGDMCLDRGPWNLAVERLRSNPDGSIAYQKQDSRGPCRLQKSLSGAALLERAVMRRHLAGVSALFTRQIQKILTPAVQL
jgi:hypothetical protein